jgi:hypothetical protein
VNSSLPHNYVLVNRFFKHRVSIISSLGRRTIELLGLNLRPLFISTNCLVLTNAINKASLQYPQSLRLIACGYYYTARLREDRLYVKVVYA